MFPHRSLMLSLILLLASGLLAPVASAKDASEDTPVEFSFEDDLVSGSVPSPLGEVLTVRTKGKRESLIRVREQWVREMCQSVEDL